MMCDVKRRYRRLLYLCIGICMICVGCRKEQSADLQTLVLDDTKENEVDSDEEETSESEKSEQSAEDIWIYICGAVNEPGVYRFDSEVHLCEVVEKAGGFNSDAAATYLNQAQLVGDGEQVYVPTQQEVDEGMLALDKQQQESDIQQNSEVGKININKATREELMTLSGIGESKADSIISYREKQGAFRQVEDIMQIEGIKEGVFQKIKDQITV